MKNRANIYLMYAIVFLQGFIFYGPVSTIYRQARGLSMYEIFLLEAVFFILMITFEVPWGWFADRYGYKTTLVISNILFFFSKIAFYEADSFSLFILETVLVALAISGISGCDTALLYSSVKEDEGEKVFGRYNALSRAGLLCAAVSATFIITESIDLPAFLTIFPYGIAAFLTLFLKEVKDTSKSRPNMMKSVRSALANKSFLIFILSVALIGEVTHAVSVFLNQPQYLRSGIDLKYFGILLACIQGVAIISAKTHRITERFGRNKSLVTLMVLVTACCFALAAFNNPVISVFAVALIVGSFAIIQTISLDIQNKSINTDDRATVLSLYAMGGDITGVIIKVIIGRSADASLVTSLVVCGFISMAAFMALQVYLSQIKRKAGSCNDIT